MSARGSLLFAAPLALAMTVAAAVACNSGTADCPAKATINQGGACSDDQLQCPYDLPTPSPACDGTSATIPSSCLCTKGRWVCPDAISCGDGGADGGGDGGSDDGGGDGAADDGPTDDGQAADGPMDGAADG